MMHSANCKSITEHGRLSNQQDVMLTFVSRNEVLDVFRNVLVEMQLAYIERLDNGAVV